MNDNNQNNTTQGTLLEEEKERLIQTGKLYINSQKHEHWETYVTNIFLKQEDLEEEIADLKVSLDIMRGLSAGEFFDDIIKSDLTVNQLNVAGSFHELGDEFANYVKPDVFVQVPKFLSKNNPNYGRFLKGVETNFLSKRTLDKLSEQNKEVLDYSVSGGEIVEILENQDELGNTLCLYLPENATQPIKIYGPIPLLKLGDKAHFLGFDSHITRGKAHVPVVEFERIKTSSMEHTTLQGLVLGRENNHEDYISFVLAPSDKSAQVKALANLKHTSQLFDGLTPVIKVDEGRYTFQSHLNDEPTGVVIDKARKIRETLIIPDSTKPHFAFNLKQRDLENKEITQQLIDFSTQPSSILIGGDIFNAPFQIMFGKEFAFLYVNPETSILDLGEPEKISSSGRHVFVLKNIEIDSENNITLEIESSTKKSFSSIKFYANEIVISRKGQNNEHVPTQTLNMTLPTNIFKLISDQRIKTKNLPAQFADVAPSLSNLAVLEFTHRNKTFKILKAKHETDPILYIVHKNKLLEFETKDIYMHIPTDPKEKAFFGISTNKSSTAGQAISNLSSENAEKIARFIEKDNVNSITYLTKKEIEKQIIKPRRISSQSQNIEKFATTPLRKNITQAKTKPDNEEDKFVKEDLEDKQDDNVNTKENLDDTKENNEDMNTKENLDGMEENDNSENLDSTLLNESDDDTTNNQADASQEE